MHLAMVQKVDFVRYLFFTKRLVMQQSLPVEQHFLRGQPPLSLHTARAAFAVFPFVRSMRQRDLAVEANLRNTPSYAMLLAPLFQRLNWRSLDCQRWLRVIDISVASRWARVCLLICMLTLSVIQERALKLLAMSSAMSYLSHRNRADGCTLPGIARTEFALRLVRFKRTTESSRGFCPGMVLRCRRLKWNSRRSIWMI